MILSSQTQFNYKLNKLLNRLVKKNSYKVEIPKKLFDVYERTDKENIVVNIEGIFSKNDRIVLGISERSEGRLVRD